MHAQQIQTITSKFQSTAKLEDLVLPSPPVILQHICELQNDPLHSADDVVELLKDYPVVTERLIKLSSSAKFRTVAEITCVKAAILRLGISRVLSLVSGMSISQYLSATHTVGLEKYFAEMWQQTLNVASIAFVLAEVKTKVDSEKALLAGMVHNIGVLPILLTLNDTPAIHDSPTIMRIVADSIIPKYYPYAGRVLMQSWNLPDEIVSIATSHRHSLRPKNESIDLADIIHIAFSLNSVKDYTDLENEPTELVRSFTFQKFWPTWEDATNQLRTLDESIQNVRSIIAI